MKQFLYFISLIGLCVVCFVQNNALHEMKAVINAQKNYSYAATVETIQSEETEKDEYILAEPFDSGDNILERIDTLVQHFELSSKSKPSPDWAVTVLMAARASIDSGADK